MSIFQNAAKPKGFGGKLFIKSMNMGHKSLHKWGFSHLDIRKNAVCLDIGCGGGTNLKRILDMSMETTAHGVDYSDVSVEKSRQRCKKEIAAGRCKVDKMNVLELRDPRDTYDLVTAFETIYFWQDIDKAFKNVYGVLKKGGKFFICNESNGKNKDQEKWCEIIDGMKIYKIEEIQSALLSAGFCDVEIDDSHDVWLAITATK